jgi:ABC-type transporter Mla MlaB component
MSLKISKKKSVYYLKGEIIKATVNSFLSYFEKKLNTKEKIVLNIDKTKEIDKAGLSALKEILAQGVQNSKVVFITGKGCKEIYDDLQHIKAV